MPLNTHFQGKTTELEVALAFLNRGYLVSQPLVSDSRYDFIVDINNQLYRIQVKTCHTDNEDKDYIVFATSSSHTNTNRTFNRSYTSKEIDYFATYYNGECYLVPVEEAAHRSQRLRFNPPKNGMQQGVKLAKNYHIDKILATLND